MGERSETNEMWREIREEQRAARARARDAAHGRLQRLEKAGLIKVERFSRDHVRIRQPQRRGIQVDFWPSTGRWLAMGYWGSRTDWDGLMRYLDIPESARHG